MMRVACLMLFGLALLTAGGCVYRISPPDAPSDPVSVFIADEGYHASLALPREDGSVIFYAYGRFDWYALNESEFWRAPGAALVPGEGTLGRCDLPGPCTYESLQDRLEQSGVLEALIELRVDRSRMRALRDRLDQRFADGGAVVRNTQIGMWFVRDPKQYWLGRNCNAELADWIRELGCEVTGSSLDADFRVGHTHVGPSRR